VLTEAIASRDTSRNDLLKVAAGGVLTGFLTPLLPYLIDKIANTPADFRIALVAIPFAVLVFLLVRRFSANPWWAAVAAAIVTMIAFVCAVNAAIWIDGHVGDLAKTVRSIIGGLTGGFIGAGIMALGIGALPSGPRQAAAWLPMLAVGTVAGTLLAIDSALDSDLVTFLYPVWQAGVAVGLVRALRGRTGPLA
jgi:branched-subunit amino acid transport protein AzlD